MNSTFFFLSFLLSFTPLSQCHMIMKTPVPYGVSSLNNSPLDGSGSDFPCKQRSGVYDVTTMNQMAVGAPQILSFTGSAVHGGGSCQLSVTLDKQPTKDSTWKVIHSIIGGCPSGATGNLGSNDDATFQFSLPQGFPNGEATLAWTWFNKIGNREMYMNCAPITVTGGSDSRDTFNSLPNMFVANIGVTSCHTTEGKDVVFPDPGPSPATPASTPLVPETFASNCELGGAPAGPQPPQAPSYTQVPQGPGSTQQQNPYATLSTMPMQMPPPSNPGPVVTQTVGSIVTETFGAPQGPFGTWVPAVPGTPFPGATQICATTETFSMPLGADTTNRQLNPTGLNQAYPNAGNRQFSVPALLRLLAQALISDGIVEARALDLNLMSSATSPSITGTPSPYVPHQPTATQPVVSSTQLDRSTPAASVSDGTAFVTATIPPMYPSAGQPNVITLTTVLSPTDGVPSHGPETVITSTLSWSTSSEWQPQPSLSAGQMPSNSYGIAPPYVPTGTPPSQSIPSGMFSPTVSSFPNGGDPSQVWLPPAASTIVQTIPYPIGQPSSFPGGQSSFMAPFAQQPTIVLSPTKTYPFMTGESTVGVSSTFPIIPSTTRQTFPFPTDEPESGLPATIPINPSTTRQTFLFPTNEPTIGDTTRYPTSEQTTFSVVPSMTKQTFPFPTNEPTIGETTQYLTGQQPTNGHSSYVACTPVTVTVTVPQAFPSSFFHSKPYVTSKQISAVNPPVFGHTTSR